MRKESGMGRMWVNPYKSLVPQVGYYDINCLIEALKLKKCHVSLHAVFNPKVRPYPYLRGKRKKEKRNLELYLSDVRNQPSMIPNRWIESAKNPSRFG